ncbi:hypothetical protein DQ384_40075 [Sphaerisporangium album]|uniref:Uncharacterized protein n=2 Tax=Sphaerisporangium album TaxID=509200 RepID=A0A367EHY5_9ACTN|nr:hypothetical protein DQ384_40075 [Sphaerisporangium album]
MIRLARAALYTVLPAELLLVVLLASGVTPPRPLLAVTETAVALVILLETATAYRLFRAARRRGADRRAALRETVHRLVPAPLRRIIGFELKAMASVVSWVAHRRDGVPPGATAASYSREQTPMLLMVLFVMIVETVGLDLLLSAFDVPAGVRVPVLVIDVYGIVIVLAYAAASVTRPHVATPGELRIRHGVHLDVRVPRDQIASARSSRNYNERGMITVSGDTLAVAVSSQTNVTIDLTRPLTVTRPLGSQVDVTTIRFFADNPVTVLNALNSRELSTP